MKRCGGEEERVREWRRVGRGVEEDGEGVEEGGEGGEGVGGG